VAKRNRASTPRAIARRLAEGRGHGVGSSYNPWLHIQDVASKGLVSRVQGWKTNRVHHFLSLLELRYFYALEWEQNVVDIREQYPLLPLEETLAIADECGVKHPTDPKTKHPIVMSTDFLYTVRLGIFEIDYARTVKYSNDLQSIRTLVKLEIERRYWRARGIDWKIVTERDISTVLAGNVEWIHPYADLCNFTSLPDFTVQQIVSLLTKSVQASSLNLRDITNSIDGFLDLEAGTSLSIVRHLIACRRWQVDMNHSIDPCRRLVLISD
jgi:TnsA endonuclease C terminal./TnsA endonuclease N terminal.